MLVFDELDSWERVAPLLASLPAARSTAHIWSLPMHLNNVQDYAPGGYKLARTAYEEGKCRHVFSAEGKPDLVCELPSDCNRDQEREALERFRTSSAEYTLGDYRASVDARRAGKLVEFPQISVEANDAANRRLPPGVSTQMAAAVLRAALDEGDASPVAEGYSLDKVLAKIDATEKPSENLVSEAFVRLAKAPSKGKK